MSDFSHMCLNVYCSVRMRELINASSVTFEFLALLFFLFACFKLALQVETMISYPVGYTRNIQISGTPRDMYSVLNVSPEGHN